MQQISSQEILTSVIGGTIILILLGGVIISFLFIYQKRHNKFISEKKELESQFQQTLLQSQLEIQEQTLKNISQEIHDNVGQVLTLAKLNLATTAVQDEASTEKINTSKQLIAKAIQDLRDLSRSLDTDYVEEMGLVRSIEYELELLKKTGTIETELSIEGKAIRLEKQKELILFRIVQEAIHNIMKHAEAKKIAVLVQFQPNELSVRIVDDGKGFDLSPLKDPGNQTFGFGLRNMNSRATLIGAKFLMNSTIEKGTEVYLSLPLNGDINEATTKN
jgi:two-component system, NarL family, sensor kinase